MGFFKLCVLTAGGLFAYRSIQRVNGLAKSIVVPKGSALYKLASKEPSFVDAYKVELPRHFKLIKGKDSGKHLNVTELARSFYGSKVFANFEHYLLVYLARADKPDLQRCQFKKGDTVYRWEVVEKTEQEILLTWSLRDGGQVMGSTWFHLPHDHNCLIFGSSLVLPSRSKSKNPIGVTEFGREAINEIKSSKTSWMDRIKYAIDWVSVPVHKLYSKYLLVSAMKKLIAKESK